MTLSGLVDAVIGIVSFLWFLIEYTFTRTRCCICDDKILRVELKYRIKEHMSPGSLGFRVRNPVCTRCKNKVRKSSTTEIVCLNE